MSCYATLEFSGVPKKGDKIRIGYLTPAFWGAHDWAQLLNNPFIPGCPWHRGQKPYSLPQPRLVRGPQGGRIAAQQLRSWVSRQRRRNQSWPPQSVGPHGPQIGQNCYFTPAFSKVPGNDDKIRIGYHTRAFSGAHKWAQWLHNPAFSGVHGTRDKSRMGYLIGAFSGANKWAKLLRNPCALGCPKQRGQKQNCLP